MIFANRAVAEKISGSFPKRSILRRHPLPDGRHFEKLAEAAAVKVVVVVVVVVVFCVCVVFLVFFGGWGVTQKPTYSLVLFVCTRTGVKFVKFVKFD